MSSKHTPGPWQVGFADGSGHSYITDTQGRVVVRGGYDSHGIKHGVVKKSDARLIASAPESHEVNQLFLQAINETLGISPDHSDERIYDEMPSSQLAIAYFAARAAIAKATGGAQ